MSLFRKNHVWTTIGHKIYLDKNILISVIQKINSESNILWEKNCFIEDYFMFPYLHPKPLHHISHGYVSVKWETSEIL